MRLKEVDRMPELFGGLQYFSLDSQIKIQGVCFPNQTLSLYDEFTAETLRTPYRPYIHKRRKDRQILVRFLSALLHCSHRMAKLHLGVPQQIEDAANASVNSLRSILRSQKEYIYV